MITAPWKAENRGKLIESLGIEFVPEAALRGDRGDRIHALALTARSHLGGLPAQAPGAAQYLIGAHARFIQEKDRGAPAFGAFSPPRENVFRPARNGLGVAFVGPAQGLPGHDVEFVQQPTDRRQPRGYPEFLLDQRRDDLARPQPEVKAVLARIFPVDPTAYLKFLFRGKCRFPARGLA